jgi:hypothetical protein
VRNIFGRSACHTESSVLGSLNECATTHVVLGGKDLERGLDDTSSESENEVESGFLLDV